MKKVTIVIPNYNGKALLENCIRTLEEQTYSDFKILIIDNGSTDGSLEIKSDLLDMEVIALGENTGFCKAVNLGIKKTKTPYVLLLNNDIEAEPHFVEEMVKGITASPDIFSGSAMMIDFKNHKILDNAGDIYTILGWARARGKGKAIGLYEKKAEIFSSCGGAAIYRMEYLQKTGLLDEHHFAYLEDVDLGYRAKLLGYRNCYFPEAKVYHVGSATTGARYNEKKVYLAARNSMFVIYKNMPPLQRVINFPFLLAGVGIKYLFFVKKGFGKNYRNGIRDGLKKRGSLKPFYSRKISTFHYIRVETELIRNTFHILK